MPTFGTHKLPSMKRASKYDHGAGPKEFTHMNKAVAGTGKSQSPKQVKIARSGRPTGTGR
jgi:carbonic anhydrase